MAGVRALVLIYWAGLAAAQVKFPSKSGDNPTETTTTTSSPVAASQQDAQLQSSQPDNPGQTRFAPGFGGNPNVIGLFNECHHCSFSTPQLAQQCCHTRQLCCSFLQTFPGQFPGVVGPGVIPGPVGPIGVPGQGFHGGKVGTCPLVAGLQSGFGRFSGAACVAECRNDFDCHDQMKCCPAGCSTVCRNPQGAVFAPIVIHPTVKPGSCPPKGLLGFLGLRSGADGASAATDAPANTDTEDARLQEQQDGKDRRINRKERQERKRSRRSRDRQDQEDRRERRRNRLNRVYGRVIRSANLQHREDRRERQRNRKNRVFGRVIRSANLQHREDRRERQRNRKNRVFGRIIRSVGLEDDARRNKRRRYNKHDVRNSRVIRQADPNQRFFFGNPFCQSRCSNDFDCPGNLKCCSRNKDCTECLSPTFP